MRKIDFVCRIESADRLPAATISGSNFNAVLLTGLSTKMHRTSFIPLDARKKPL
jgi:hypothetical protein